MTDSAGERFSTRGRSLRVHTARGTIVNAVFLIGLASLGLLKGFVVAAFLTKRDFAIWGILVVGLGTLSWLKGSSIGDKFVQQSEQDQELAFQKAFTLELAMTGVLMLILVVALPILALIYGQWRVVPPGLVIILLGVPATALQTPVWVFYRRMEFVRQRTLQLADPLLGFVVTVALAIAGAGYWSLVVGTVAGAAAGAAITIRSTPYRLRLRYDRGTLGEYFAFSWPVVIGAGSALVIAQGSILVGNIALGIAAVGVIALASQISAYADRVDAIVTQTLYPAICAVKDRTELLFEAFVKSNRLALMWGLPFGVGLALFAPDLVRYVIGERWHQAIHLIQVFGFFAAVHQIGFNWTAFYSARAETRPIAVVNVATMLAFLATVPVLTAVDGLDGFAIGMSLMTIANFAGRSVYLARLFRGFGMFRHTLRAVAPTVPAAAVVLVARALDGSRRTPAAAAAELAAYVVVTVIATAFTERELLAEVLGYLSRRGGGGAPSPPQPAEAPVV